MLDIRLIREKPDFVRERLAARGGGDEAKIDEVLRIDAERRKSETELQRLQSERNRLSKEIGARRSRKEPSEELEAEVRKIGEQIAGLTQRANALDEEQRNLLLGYSKPAACERSNWQGSQRKSGRPQLGREAAINQCCRSRCARHETESLQSRMGGETEREWFHLFYRRRREARARIDQFHDRSAHTRAWVFRSQSAVCSSARLHDRHVAASEV